MRNENYQTSAFLTFIKFAVRKWFILVISLVVFLSVATVYAFTEIKPSYRAYSNIVLKMAISDSVSANTNINNATLAKLNVPTVKEWLTSTKITKAANEYYNLQNGESGESVKKSAIKVNYDESSMIFSLGYVDVSEEGAIKKLDAIINTAPSILNAELEAESVDLVLAQNVFSVDVSDGRITVIVIGGALGGVFGVGLTLVFYYINNSKQQKEN